MKLTWTFALMCTVLSVALSALAQSTPKSEQARGALLYTTHCIACHSTQIHWRDQRLATDWMSLKAQIRRWQSNTGLNWNNDEIADVARYLNERYYRYPQTSDQVRLIEPAFVADWSPRTR